MGKLFKSLFSLSLLVVTVGFGCGPSPVSPNPSPSATPTSTTTAAVDLNKNFYFYTSLEGGSICETKVNISKADDSQKAELYKQIGYEYGIPSAKKDMDIQYVAEAGYYEKDKTYFSLNSQRRSIQPLSLYDDGQYKFLKRIDTLIRGDQWINISKSKSFSSPITGDGLDNTVASWDITFSQKAPKDEIIRISIRGNVDFVKKPFTIYRDGQTTPIGGVDNNFDFTLNPGTTTHLDVRADWTKDQKGQVYIDSLVDKDGTFDWGTMPVEMYGQINLSPANIKALAIKGLIRI